MKFSSDELMPFFEVRTGMSKHLDDVQAGKEIVITRHGKPEGALLSAAQLFRYREVDRLMVQLLEILTQDDAKPVNDSRLSQVIELAKMTVNSNSRGIN